MTEMSANTLFFDRKGISLLGLLISITLCLLLITAGLQILQSFKHLEESLDLKLKRELQRSKLLLITQQMLDELNTNRFKLYPKIHPIGEIKFYNGQQIDFNNPLNRPDSQSQAISFIRSSFQESLIILTQNNNQAIACPLFAQNFDNQSVKGFLGISNQKILYLLADNHYRPSERCWDIKLKATNSIYFPEAKEEIPFIKILVPIYADYTIYRSNSKMLRHLSFTGDQLTENQPIIEAPEYFHFAEEFDFQQEIYALNLIFPNLTSGTPRVIKNTAMLRKENPFNFIFNVIRNYE